jgi:hypothetical protein
LSAPQRLEGAWRPYIASVSVTAMLTYFFALVSIAQCVHYPLLFGRSSVSP